MSEIVNSIGWLGIFLWLQIFVYFFITWSVLNSMEKKIDRLAKALREKL